MIFKRICILFLLSLSTVIQANEISVLSPQDNSVLTEANVPITISVTNPSQIDHIEYSWIYGGCWDEPVSGCFIRRKGSIGQTTTAPYDLNFKTTTLENDTNYYIIACAYLTTGGSPICDRANNLTIQHSEPTLNLLRTLGPIRITRPYTDGTIPPALPSWPVWSTNFSLSARTSDEDGISSVKFYVDDNVLIGTATKSINFEDIYRLPWDITQVKNGWHRVYVESTDNTDLTSSDDPNEINRGSFYIENHYIPQNVYGRAKGYHLNVIWEGTDEELTYAVYRRLDTETNFSFMGKTPNRVWVDDMPIGTGFAEYYIRSVYKYGISEPSATVTVYPTFRRRR